MALTSVMISLILSKTVGLCWSLIITHSLRCLRSKKCVFLRFFWVCYEVFPLLQRLKTQKPAHKKLIFPSEFPISDYAFTIIQVNQAQNKTVTISNGFISLTNPFNHQTPAMCFSQFLLSLNASGTIPLDYYF